MNKIIKSIVSIITLFAIVSLLSGCGQDPAKMPPDQLLKKAVVNMTQKGGAFEVKETMIIGAGTSNAMTLLTEGAIEPAAKAAYIEVKDMPEKGMSMNIYYDKEAKDTYLKFVKGKENLIIVTEKNLVSELSFAAVEKLLLSMQDPEKMTELKLTAEGDKLVLEGMFKPEVLNYLQLLKATLKYTVDRKSLVLQEINYSALNLEGTKIDGTYTFKPGLKIPVLSEEEKAKAMRQ